MALEQEILLSVKCAGKVAKMWTVKSLWIVMNTLVEKCVENVENSRENSFALVKSVFSENRRFPQGL